MLLLLCVCVCVCVWCVWCVCVCVRCVCVRVRCVCVWCVCVWCVCVACVWCVCVVWWCVWCMCMWCVWCMRGVCGVCVVCVVYVWCVHVCVCVVCGKVGRTFHQLYKVRIDIPSFPVTATSLRFVSSLWHHNNHALAPSYLVSKFSTLYSSTHGAGEFHQPRTVKPYKESNWISMLATLQLSFHKPSGLYHIQTLKLTLPNGLIAILFFCTGLRL